MQKAGDNRWTQVLTGVFFLALGISFFFGPEKAFDRLGLLIGLALIVLGGIQLIGYFVARHKGDETSLMRFLTGLVTLVFGVILALNVAFMKMALLLLFGIWAFVMGIVKLIVAYQYRRDGVNSWKLPLAAGIGSLIFSLFAFLGKSIAVYIAAIVTGLYFTLYGIYSLGELTYEWAWERKEKAGRKPPMKKWRRISKYLPIWIEMFFPKTLFHMIKEQLLIDDANTVREEHTYMRPEASAAYEASASKAEVLLHLFEGFTAFGHMDFAFDDRVISYGCYDSSANRLFGCISDGVLAVSDRKPYLNYCIQQEKKVLIGYQLLLTPEQETAVRDRLAEFQSALIPWDSDALLWRRGKLKTRRKKFNDPASLLQEQVDVRFFKFRRGSKFKTYFVLNTNCAMLVDEIMGVLGEDCITPPGSIITPGACYRYFEGLLRMPESMVVGRRIYLQ